MILRFIFSVLIVLPLTATAVQSNDHWLKVETQKEQPKQSQKDTHLYDSLEAPIETPAFASPGLWTLDTRVTAGFGFLADRAFWETGNSSRWFFNAGLQWRVRPWHRLSSQVLLLQNNTLFLSTSWDYTPSRTQFRPYYGVGLAHQVLASKQISNLLEIEQYYLTGKAGIEYLLESKHGLLAEAKLLLGTQSYALQVTFGYLIPL